MSVFNILISRLQSACITAVDINARNEITFIYLFSFHLVLFFLP